MSTRSIIGTTDGTTFEGIYCHFDLRRPSGAACSTLQGGGEHRLGRAAL